MRDRTPCSKALSSRSERRPTRWSRQDRSRPAVRSMSSAASPAPIRTFRHEQRSACLVGAMPGCTERCRTSPPSEPSSRRSPNNCHGPMCAGGRWRSRRRSSSLSASQSGRRRRSRPRRDWVASSRSTWRSRQRSSNSCSSCSSTASSGQPPSRFVRWQCRPAHPRRCSPVTGLACVEAGAVDAVVEVAALLREDCRLLVSVGSAWPQVAMCASEIAAAAGDRVLAQVLWTPLLRHRGTGLALHAAGYLGTVDRCLGLLAATQGDVAGARALLASAIEQERQRGAAAWERRAVADLEALRTANLRS